MRLVQLCPCLLSVVVVCAIAPSATADEVATLDEATFLRRVAARAPAMAMADADVAIARADLLDAGVRPRPSLALERDEVFTSGEALPEHTLRLDWPVELGGRRTDRLAAARHGIAAAHGAAARARHDVLADAIARFDEAAAAHAIVAVLHEARVALARLVDVVRARTGAGDASGYDQRRLEIELGMFDADLADAEVDLASRRLDLGALVGEPGTPYDAVPAPAPRTLARSTAAIADVVDTRSDVRAAGLRALSATALVAAARRTRFAEITLSAGLRTADLGSETAWGYVVGVSIPLPTSDPDAGARARAAGEAARANAYQDALRAAAVAAVVRARDEVDRRVAQRAAHVAGPAAAVAALVPQAETAYREGERPISELLDVHRTARDVRLQGLAIDVALQRAARALQTATTEYAPSPSAAERTP